mgnify:CR=1 FL=1
MSAVKDIRDANLAEAEIQKTNIDTIISTEGIGADLQGVVVSIQFSVTVQQSPGSAISEAAAQALAETYGWELYIHD